MPHILSAGHIHTLRVEGDFLILPGCGFIPKDTGELGSKRPAENHASMGFGKPEDKFIHWSSCWVEFFLGDFFESYGGRAFEVTATGKTSGKSLVKFYQGGIPVKDLKKNGILKQSSRGSAQIQKE